MCCSRHASLIAVLAAGPEASAQLVYVRKVLAEVMACRASYRSWSERGSRGKMLRLVTFALEAGYLLFSCNVCKISLLGKESDGCLNDTHACERLCRAERRSYGRLKREVAAFLRVAY